MALTAVKLLAVWDTDTFPWPPDRAPWLLEHGLLAFGIYRAEFYRAETPFVRLFTYHVNEQGFRHFTDAHVTGPHDHEQCAVAVNPPYDRELWELPPGVKATA